MVRLRFYYTPEVCSFSVSCRRAILRVSSLIRLPLAAKTDLFKFRILLALNTLDLALSLTTVI